MEKSIIFSDLHLHPHAGDWLKVSDSLAVLQWVLKTAVAEGIKTVFFLGDFFHNREKVYSLVVGRSFDVLKKFEEAGIHIYMVVGNHDMPLKNTTQFSALTIFQEFKNIEVISQPKVLEYDDSLVFMLPYVENIDKLKWALQELESRRSPTKKNYLLAHLDIAKAWFNNFKQSDFGLEVENLITWDFVVSGHFHNFQKVRDNILYVGSPLQINFGDAKTVKGIIIHDNGKFDFRENTFSPQYLHITPEEISEKVRNNYVSLAVKDMEKIDEFRKKILDFNPRHLEINLVAEEINNDASAMLQSGWDLKRNIDNLAKFWVETYAPQQFDKDKLLATGLDIIHKVNTDAV
jgi:DNA repair exonuclease SbcCD nuclease subunit